MYPRAHLVGTRRTASATRAGRDVDSWPWHEGRG